MTETRFCVLMGTLCGIGTAEPWIAKLLSIVWFVAAAISYFTEKK